MTHRHLGLRAVALALRVGLALAAARALKFDRFGLLCRMRMLIRMIDLQSFYQALAKLVLRQHSQDRIAQEPVWS